MHFREYQISIETSQIEWTTQNTQQIIDENKVFETTKKTKEND